VLAGIVSIPDNALFQEWFAPADYAIALVRGRGPLRYRACFGLYRAVAVPFQLAAPRPLCVVLGEVTG
jgi:hypothetical protein